jgi:hypothetical protein
MNFHEKVMEIADKMQIKKPTNEPVGFYENAE